MANRQALREFQERLAQRLQDARKNAGQAAIWLAVEASGKRYLVPLEQAEEIFPWQEILSVPYTQPWFWGVANLRGNLTGIVDLGGCLGHPVARSDQLLQEVSLLVVNSNLQANVALVIDTLQGLRGVEDFVSMKAVDTNHDEPQVVGAIYTDRAGEEWQILHIHQLVQLPNFLSVRI